MELKLMIIDDSNVIRGKISRALTRHNMRVVATAANGEEAVERFLPDKPDIVTMDLTMPRMDGLETPQERAHQGKQEQGAIAVYLSEAGDGALELSFRDDGAGINVEKLREAAVRVGALNAEKAKVADVRQLTELIFKPGFSTHESVDEDAGRGVGLDVVRDLVARVRGRIHIGTAPGKYCHFRVQIPSHLFASSNLATLALQAEAHS